MLCFARRLHHVLDLLRRSSRYNSLVGIGCRASSAVSRMQRAARFAHLELALRRALHMTGITLPETTAADQARMLAAATRAELQAFLRALGLAELADADWSDLAAGMCCLVSSGGTQMSIQAMSSPSAAALGSADDEMYSTANMPHS